MTEDGQRDASTNGLTRRTMGAQLYSSRGMKRNENNQSVLKNAQVWLNQMSGARAPLSRALPVWRLRLLSCDNDVTILRSATAPCAW